MTKVLDDTVSVAFVTSPPREYSARYASAAPPRSCSRRPDGAAMLVFGSRGHGGFTGLLLGSVSANVAEHASCPVLIIHGDQAPPSVKTSWPGRLAMAWDSVTLRRMVPLLHQVCARRSR